MLQKHSFDPLKAWLSFEEARSIAKVDGVQSQTDLAQLFLCVNTWCYVTEDIAGHDAAFGLARRLLITGLKATDAYYSKCANFFLGNPEEVRSYLACVPDELVHYVSSQDACCDGWISDYLEILRFAHRFTYSETSEAERDASFQKIVDINNRCYDPFVPEVLWTKGLHQFKYSNCVSPGSSVISLVKDEIRHMLPPRAIKPYGFFSSGSTNDAGKLKCDKIFALSNQYGCYGTTPDRFGMHRLNMSSSELGHLDHKLTTLDLLDVPKSMDQRRIIAPEPAARAYYASTVRVALEESLVASGTKPYISWDNQEINRQLARLGSVSGGWATIDMTSASDSISRAILFKVMPEYWRPFLANSISDYFRVPTTGKTIRMKMFSTSGNQLTWLVEAVYFLAIARVVVRFTGGRAYAYGDDLIVPDDCFEAVCELLRAFGHVVNDTKSFNVGPFRESCGGDYFNGTDVSSRRWPRTVVDLVRDFPSGLKSLTSLQHSLYSYPRTRWFLDSAVFALFPKMTYSPVGSECDDLWGSFSSEPHLERHAILVSRPNKSRSINPMKREAYDRFNYYEFLRLGPRYSSSLDELLGTSEGYVDYESDAFGTSTRWVVAKAPYKF